MFWLIENKSQLDEFCYKGFKEAFVEIIPYSPFIHPSQNSICAIYVRPVRDVKVNIEEDILKISYKKPEEDEAIHPGTIYRGLARRSFDLGYKISAKYDLSKAEAKLENGLLEITIPTSEKAKPKVLKIK